MPIVGPHEAADGHLDHRRARPGQPHGRQPHVPPPDEWSHTHKVRVVGDLMITNVEQDRRHFLRKGDKIAGLRAKGLSDPQIARELAVKDSDIAVLEEALARGYHSGGFRVWDISDKTAPRLLSYVKTHGFGVHRFDMDENYAYISTEMEGYVGNILVIYDLSDPANPRPRCRAGTCRDSISRAARRRHGRAMAPACTTRCAAGDELWAAVWHAGIPGAGCHRHHQAHASRAAIVFPPAIPEPTHTVMPLEQPDQRPPLRRGHRRGT